MRLIVSMSFLGLLVIVFTSPRDRATQPRDDEANERLLLARRAVGENCAICHATELIEAQRLTPKQWKAEVEKMVGWGSPLPADQVTAVVDYLAATYAADAKPAAEKTLTVADALETIAPEPRLAGQLKGDPARGETLHAKNCANCHAPDAQGNALGPNLVERPILLRPLEFAEITRKGRGRMPGFATILDAQAEADLLAWLRERRYRAGSRK